MRILSSCLVFVSIWLIHLHSVSAGRILVGAAIDVKSHLGSMMPLIKKLASAGHQITLFHASSNEAISDEAMSFGANITAVCVQMKKYNKDQVHGIIWSQTMHSPMLGLVYLMVSGVYSEFATDHSDVMRDTLNQEYDLIIASALFNIHFFAFADILKRHQNVPFVIFASSNFFSSYAYDTAMAQNWVTSPEMFGFEPKNSNDQFNPSNFLTRLQNVGEHLGEMATMSFVDRVLLPPQVAKLSGRMDFSFQDLYKQSSVQLSDAIGYLGLPTALVSEAKVVGAHCQQPSQLPKEFLEFVEDPKSKGTIYIAFGTIVPWDFASENIKNVLFDALDQLVDYRLIFAFNGHFPHRKLPAHLRLVKWAPQLDILQHPNTKVFLTHGGLKSVKESLCTKTPMLVMPMFAEQGHNAKYVLKYGIGGALNKYNLSKETILEELNKVLNNPEYSQRVDKMRTIFLDRPIADLDEAEFYVSRSIKMKGKAMFFRRTAVDMYLLQYFHLDLLIFVVLVLLITKQ